MNQELVEYIKQQTSLNVSKNKITDVLLGQGWQQSELDEAFAAAEGAAKGAGKISFDDSESGDIEDVEGDGGSGDPKKKIILIGGVTILLVLLVGGILAFNSGKGGEKEPVVKENPAEVTQKPAENNGENPATETNPGEEQPLEKPAVDNTPLIEAASRLSKTITPPAGWQLRQGIVSDRPMIGYFKPQVEGTTENPLTENISVTAESLKASGFASSADYLAKAKASLANMPNYKVTNEKPVTLSDGTAATLIGSSSTKDGNPIRSIQLFAFKDEVAYMVTAVALESNWEAEKDMLGAAVLSFKFPEN